MLVLSRKQDEVIRIGSNISIRIVSIHGGTVRLGIEAPAEIPVHRSEVYERIQAENRMAVRPIPGELASIAEHLRNQIKDAAGKQRGSRGDRK